MGVDPKLNTLDPPPPEFNKKAPAKPKQETPTPVLENARVRQQLCDIAPSSKVFVPETHTNVLVFHAGLRRRPLRGRDRTKVPDREAPNSTTRKAPIDRFVKQIDPPKRHISH